MTLYTEEQTEKLLQEVAEDGLWDAVPPPVAKIAEAYVNAKSMGEEKRLVHQATCILRARQKREML